LAFSNPLAADVTLQMIDMQGKILAIKNLGTLFPGKHVIQLNSVFPSAGMISKGIYWLRLKSGNESIATKVVF
jgi:hypothetical protein